MHTGLTMYSEKKEGLSICEFTESELRHPDYYSWLRNFDNIIYLGRFEYYLNTSFSDIESYVLNLIKSDKDCFFATYFGDKFIGTLKIGHIDLLNSVAEIGFLIGASEYKGKGLGTEIVRMGCKYAFERLGLRKIEGGCFASNIPSNKVFQKAGFVLEGTLRNKLKIGNRYDDHNLYGLFPDELIM